MAAASTISSNIWRQRIRARLVGYGSAGVLVMGAGASGHLDQPAVPLAVTVAGLAFAIPARRLTNVVFALAVAFDALAVTYLALMADSWTLAGLAVMIAGSMVAVGRQAKAALPVSVVTVAALVVMVLGERGVVARPSFIPRMTAPIDTIAVILMTVVLSLVAITVLRHIVHLYGRAAIGVEDNTRRWWEFMESASQPMIVAIDGVVARANRSAASLAGRPIEAMPGLPIADLVDDDVLRRPDGTVAHVTAVSAPMAVDADLAQIMFLIDTSDTVEEKRVLERTVADADRILASVSHEVRTPLTAVVGLSSVAEEAWDELSAAEQREFVRLIASQSRDVAAIIEDLLVAARVGTTGIRVDRQAVDLAAETDQVLSTLDMQGRHVMVTGSGHAVADPVRVRQILRNLLTNAVRYGGSTIEVRLASDGTAATVSVLDDGDPIPPAARELIFQPFARNEHALAARDSVGLGLTVSRQLAELMAGTLVYDHRDGWSTFVLTLPVAQP